MTRFTEHKPVYLTGPTAVGKTEVSLELAELLHAEIVSADSMLVYQGMDIGTAKPSPAERARVPHHLIDSIPITEEFDAAKFCRMALQVMDEIRERGKRILVTGGSGMYLRALTDGIFEGVGSDPRIRTELEQELTLRGKDALREELARLDSATHQKLLPGNTRRLIRALEVYRMTGKPISEWQNQWKANANKTPLVGLNRDRAELYQRIETRVDAMFNQGLVEEVRSLDALGIRRNKTAAQAVGYKEVLEFMNGHLSHQQCIEKVKLNTRHLAKKQLTWFRHQAIVNWFNLDNKVSSKEIAERIFRSLKSND